MGAELFHADRQTERDEQAYWTKLIVAFRNLVDAPKKKKKKAANRMAYDVVSFRQVLCTSTKIFMLVKRL